MPEVTDGTGRLGSAVDPVTKRDPVTERVLATPGVGPLVAEAEAVWRSRATSTEPHSTPVAPHRGEADLTRPAWRPFEDAFPTFYQFTNRPPRSDRN